MNLQQIIHDKIKQEGPMTVADYMSLALGHSEYGYYITRDPFGEKGDFITAPEISQIFGELIGAWAATLWQQRGGGDIALVELGPGRGTLMQDMLRATAHVPGFHEYLCVVMVENSPTLKRFQESVLIGSHSRISWQPTIDELPGMPTIVIANEFFDALPIRQFVKTPQGLQEKLVNIDPENPEKLEFMIQEMGIRLIKGGEYSGDEVVVESSPAARSIIHTIAAHINEYGGGGLIIDYGYTGGSQGNTLQAVKNHGFHSVLEQPGEADITAHVDFDMLAETLQDDGIPTYGPLSQGTFLQRIGAELRAESLLQNASPEQQESIIAGLKRLMAPNEMGELFKVLAFADNSVETLAGFDVFESGAEL